MNSEMFVFSSQTSFVSFDSANIAAIGGKLKEFNATLDKVRKLIVLLRRRNFSFLRRSH